MQCMTCQADIPPQWVNAIQRNECPGCGGPIMDESSKELLTELKEAMSRMPNDPEGLAGWILSNYSLTKVGTGEPVGFHRKPAHPVSSENSEYHNLKIAESPVDKFLKRTGVVRPPKAEPKNYQAIVNQINNGEVDETMYGANEEDESLDPEAEETESLAYREAEINRQQMASAVKSRNRSLKNALLVPGNGQARPVSTREVEAVMDNASNNNVDFEAVPELNAARMLRLRAQEEIAMGGRAGLIRRRE